MNQPEKNPGGSFVLLTSETQETNGSHFKRFKEGALKQDILSITEEGFDWEEFVESASEVWRENIHEANFLEATRPSEKELKYLLWSSLVPGKLKGEMLTKQIERAWDVWEDFLRDEVELHPFLAIVGTMGTGKSELAEALYGFDPLNSTLQPELWKDNKNLNLFYQHLAILMSPETQQTSFMEDQLNFVQKIQAYVQGYFASLKFCEELRAMEELTSRRVIRDVSRGQDFVYHQTQLDLGLASLGEDSAYRSDNHRRQRLIPPPLKIPILVYPWVPFAEVRKRVLESRGREFEERVPKRYLETLHVNTAHWVLAMKQAGVPIITVDARRDFREFQPERESTAAAVWREVDKAHARLLAKFRFDDPGAEISPERNSSGSYNKDVVEGILETAGEVIGLIPDPEGEDKDLVKAMERFIEELREKTAGSGGG